jgi:plastocyanin
MGLLVGTALLGATPATAFERGPRVYKIGVDNPHAKGVPNHDFEYVDYFPRKDVRVHSADVLDFNWNTGSVDGAHTVSFVPPSMAPPGLFAVDTDDPGVQLEFNPQMFLPSSPTCGTQTAPCVYDGTSIVNSGFVPNAVGGDFYVKLDPKLLNGRESADINYICEIHPGMSGSVTLVADRRESTPPEVVEARSAGQFAEDTADALRQERRDDKASVKLNSDGTHTTTTTAGTATQYVEIAEMLPRTIKVKPGDTVNWVTKTLKDPHTVTFPQGDRSSSVDPLMPVCEAAADIPIPAMDPRLCASPGLFETHVIPQPQGPTAITSPTTIATSGIIANAPGVPNSYAFSFPNAGAFTYMCRIHDNMVGTIVARN